MDHAMETDSEHFHQYLHAMFGEKQDEVLDGPQMVVQESQT